MAFKFFSNLGNKKSKEISNMSASKNEVLRKENIKLNNKSVDKYEAIRMCGRLLVEGGYVEEGYIEAMIERENDLTTYIGNGVAIPHGVGKAKKNIKKSGIVVFQFPDGVDFEDEKAYIIIGIAGVGDEHIEILSNIATIIGEDENIINKLKCSNDIEYLYRIFTEN
jgi:mannitol/fructose-specific phosphotransferase system IIA component